MKAAMLMPVVACLAFVIAVVARAGDQGAAGNAPLPGLGGAAIRVDNAPPEIKVIVATPERGTWFIADDHSAVNVIVENVSGHPIDLYDAWNSWGWSNVKLEWEADGKKGQVHRRPGEWDENSPSTTPLAAGGAIVRAVSAGRAGRFSKPA